MIAHPLDFLAALQSSLNNEVIRVAGMKRNLLYIRSTFKMSQQARVLIDAEIESTTKTEAHLRQKYQEIETYKYEWRKQKYQVGK